MRSTIHGAGRGCGLLLGSLALLVLAGCSHKEKLREPTELADIVNPAIKPKIEWNASAGSGSDRIFTGLRATLDVDGLYSADLKGHVFSFDSQTGKLLWKADTKARVASGPTIAGNAVLVGTLGGEVIALKRADGSELWRQTVSSEVMAGPVGNGDIVVVRSVDGKVVGLSATSGERLWTFDRNVPALVLRGLSEPLLIGSHAIVGMDNGRVAALRLEDGQPVWEQAISVPQGRTELDRLTDIDGDLLDGPDCLYVSSFGGDLACVDATSGQVQWRRTVKNYNSLSMGGDKVYIADESGVVWALDAATGAAAWKQEGLLYRKLSPPAFFNGYVVVGDYKGYLHWLDPADGHIVARNRVGSDSIVAPPAVGENLLYVMNRKGRIAAVSLAQR